MNRLVIVIIGLLVAAAVTRIGFLLYIAYFFTGLYVWGRWVVPWTLKKITIWREYTDHAFLGENIPVRLHVRNPGWLPIPWLEITESAALDLNGRNTPDDVTAIRGRETITFDYTVRATKRGQYQIGPANLMMGDLFGFFGEHRRQYGASHVTVYPRITALADLGQSSKLPFGTIASHRRLFEDLTCPAGVRDYRPGDPLHQINWKVSGHSGHLMVKTFQPAISMDSMILLNLHRGDYTSNSWLNKDVTSEWAIELAASFAAHLIGRRQAAGLITNGVDSLREASHDTQIVEENTNSSTEAIEGYALPPAILPHGGRDHLMKILERLARISHGETVPFTQWAVPACMSLGWGMTILVITPRADEETCNAVHHLVRAGFNPILFAVEGGQSERDLHARARQLGFTAFQITQQSDLAHWKQPVGAVK